MYITLTGIQNGEPVYLDRNLPVSAVPLEHTSACEGLEVALCELTYYHRLKNISAALGNNEVPTKDSTASIRDGYYNVCELTNEIFEPLGAELSLHAPTGRLQLSAKKRPALNCRLAQLLGFSRATFEPGKTYNADEPHRLVVHREILVHLAEVSTSENLHNGRPSTLLR